MSKSKTGAKVAIGILAAALLIGGLGAATRGFRNWDPQTWFDNWGKGDESSSEDTVEEGENLQLRVFGGPRFAATAQVGDTKTATATVTPSNATDKRVTWVSSDPTKVSVANKYTNSGEANTIRLESLFAGEVTVTAYPTLLGPEQGAAVTVTFGNAPQTMYGNAFLAQTEQVGIEHFAEQMSGVWDWLDGERTEPLELNGGVVYDKPWGNDEIYINFSEDSWQVSSEDSFWLIVLGQGREGAEGLPEDIGLGSIYFDDADIGHTADFVSVRGNEFIAFLSVNEWDIQWNQNYTYKIGDAEFTFFYEQFFDANGVEVDSPTIEF